MIDVARAAALGRVDAGTGPGQARRQVRIVILVLVLVDLLCLTTALLVAHALRFEVLPGSDYLIGTAVAGVLWVGVFHAHGLYAPHHLSSLEAFRRTVSAVGLGIVLVIVLTFWLDVYLSRSWMALTLGIAVVLEVAARMVVRAVLARLRSRDAMVLRTIVVGSKAQATEPARMLDRPGSGFQMLGYLDPTRAPVAPDGSSATDRVDGVASLLRRCRTECVLVASSTIGTSEMAVVMQAARREQVLVRVYTHLTGILASRLSAQPMDEEGLLLTLKPAGLSRSQRIVKRAMDLVLASVALICVAPIMAATAIAVKLSSPGPTLFRQPRATEGGREFVMLKFRTMHVDAERRALDSGLDTSAAFFKVERDPRLTPVGGRLRRWSLDELPQLFNILRGDMSLVGPRPLPTEQVLAHGELLAPRHEVRAGLTGWWQINGRSDVEDVDEAVRMDVFYIENWSPSLDVYILLRTAGAIVSRRGAF